MVGWPNGSFSVFQTCSADRADNPLLHHVCKISNKRDTGHLIIFHSLILKKFRTTLSSVKLNLGSHLTISKSYVTHIIFVKDYQKQYYLVSRSNTRGPKKFSVWTGWVRKDSVDMSGRHVDPRSLSIVRWAEGPSHVNDTTQTPRLCSFTMSLWSLLSHLYWDHYWERRP